MNCEGWVQEDVNEGEVVDVSTSWFWVNGALINWDKRTYL